MGKKKRGEPRRPERLMNKVYPSPAERERIILSRRELIDELISISAKGKFNSRSIKRLARKYGPQEVLVVVGAIGERFGDRDMIGDEVQGYRQYRLAYARFGASRPFLSKPEFEAVSEEHAQSYAQRKFKIVRRRGPCPRVRELEDLLLVGVEYWKDITPPAVPPRPADYDVPPTGDYGYPARTLLKWGLEVDEERIANNARNVTKWRPVIPDLVRMTLDEGLLNGWPGEKASWAPYHALHMLGYLHAHHVAGRLVGLLDRENDWISDHLAAVLAQMGPQAELPLWGYVDDSRHDPGKRAIVFLTLSRIAAAYPKRRPDIVERLARLLQGASAEDAEANGYIVYVLNLLRAVEAKEAILEAFEQDKVDTEIIHPFDLDFMWEQARLDGLVRLVDGRWLAAR